jgi:hypothetical protein
MLITGAAIPNMGEALLHLFKKLGIKADSV